MQWLRENTKSEAVVETCLDFISECQFKMISLENYSYLVYASLVQGLHTGTIQKVGRSILSLLRLEDIPGSSFADVSSAMLKNLSNPELQVNGCKEILNRLGAGKGPGEVCDFVEAVFAAMIYHRNNADVQGLAFQIFEKGIGDRQRMQNLHLIEFIIISMTVTETCEEAQINGVYALKTLVSFLGYGKSEAVATIERASNNIRDKSICDQALQEIKKLNGNNDIINVNK